MRYLFSMDQRNLKNFKDAGAKILEYLYNHLGFSLWMITRKEGDDWIILQVNDHGYGIKPGQVFKWSDSYCSQMILDRTPSISPDAQDIPLYVNAGINNIADIRAYIGKPLLNKDGSLFGTLCAIDPSPQPQTIENSADLLELFSQLLSQILQVDLKLDENRRISEKLKVEALTDHLTELFNRRAWDRLLNLEESRCKTYGHPTTIIMIDLNNLKEINDKYGHAAGDKLIQKAAQTIKNCVSANDIVARLGGDEFAILNIETNLADTEKLSKRIFNALKAVNIEVAIGIAARDPSKGLKKAVKEADTKMYEHKMAMKSKK